MKPLLLSLLFMLSMPASAAVPAAAPLAGLRPAHPRLLATGADWAHLSARVAAEPDLASYHQALLAEARDVLPLPVSEYRKLGRRLLGVSREILRRVLLLSYAARMTGDTQFVHRAEAEMLASATFPDWNPSHFLDVGEATAALALGYDWLYADLSPKARIKIRRAIVEKGLDPCLHSADAKKNLWWITDENNWNQVCFGGLTLGALAVAEDEPAPAAALLELARANIHHGLAPYAPDGVYPEGPSYWAYGTSYQVLLDAALASALGRDWNLPASAGFLPSAGAYLQTQGPSGLTYNFSDGGEKSAFEPAVFWFARRLGDPGLLMFERRQLATPSALRQAVRSTRFAPLAALWWPAPGASSTAPDLPLNWLGRGPNPLAIFRDSWTDPASRYLALKGGSASLNHAHMDAGSFVYEANGVRWAIDLGAQNYESLESKGVDLWNRHQDSQRWDVYRIGNFSHNTLTIGGQRHRVDGAATLEKFSAGPVDPRVQVDLTTVFAGQATAVQRGFRLLPAQDVLVQDELTGVAPGTPVRWQMATRAEVALDGTSATLTQDGRTLILRVLAPAGADFAVQPAEPPPDGFNAANPGVRLITVTIPAPTAGPLTIAVQLAPGETAAAAPALTPLADW